MDSHVGQGDKPGRWQEDASVCDHKQTANNNLIDIMTEFPFTKKECVYLTPSLSVPFLNMLKKTK